MATDPVAAAEAVPAHDIVVVGASAGGVEALRQIVALLPTDLPAAIFVVLHVPAIATSVLPAILERAGDLPALHAEDGEAIVPGRIYIAPPDHHLLIQPGTVCVTRGPKENGYRPAIDPLFRTAAAAYGSRVVGVVLSGVLDDGTAGLAAIKLNAGKTIVQNPDDALYPMMPESAIDVVQPDLVLSTRELAGAITRLANEPADPPPAVSGDRLLDDEQFVEIGRPGGDGPQTGRPSGFTCPECGGALWESDEEGVSRFRCLTGHAFSIAALLAGQTERVEDSLWAALRALEERAAMARRMAAGFQARGRRTAAARFEQQAGAAVHHAVVLRDALQQLEPLEETARRVQ